MPSQRRVGAILGYANIVVKNLVNLVYTPMLLSFVGQADYGVFQTSNSFVFSLSLLTFGFSEAYIRFYTQRHAHGTEEDVWRLNGMYLILYSIVSVVALALGLTFAFSADVIFSGSFSADQVALSRTLMSIMSVNIAATLFSTVFDAYIMAHEEFRFQQTRQLLTTLTTPFISFALLCQGLGAVGVALAQVVVQLVLTAMNARYAIGRLGMRFDTRRFDVPLLRAVAAFSAWIFTNQVCELVNQNVPNVVLGAISGATAVSVFAVSVQIRSVFYSLSTTMSNVFTPLINRIVVESDDNAILTGLMTRVGRYQALLYCYVLGGFIVLGRFFITTWAGDGFSDAYLIIIAMVVPLIIPLVQNTGVEIQRAKNRHRARSIAYLVMAAVNLALTAGLSQLIGYWAPVVGFDAYVLLGCGVFMNWYYQRRIGLNMSYFWGRVLPVLGSCAGATVLCLVGLELSPVTNWIGFIGWGAAYSCLYVALAWVFALSSKERGAAISRIRRQFRLE